MSSNRKFDRQLSLAIDELHKRIDALGNTPTDMALRWWLLRQLRKLERKIPNE